MLPTVRSLAVQLIDDFIDRGECDLIWDFAIPFPAGVFLALFGLPSEDRDRLLVWKDAITNLFAPQDSFEPPEEVLKSAAEMYEYLQWQIVQRSLHDGGCDLLRQLLADTSEERLSTEELLGMSLMFILAGLQPVTSSLSTQFAQLAAKVELRQQIVQDPALIPGAVEELLRFEPPAPFLLRLATQETELGGYTIPDGARVHIAVGAANRDPAVYVDPDSIDFKRRQ
ncbi:MAG TPA: cytochrome P450 [Candidatus Acidoferrales bacterium]|nr:cytochrome P450 [Candidatus Acidoferrales bacterium]